MKPVNSSLLTLFALVISSFFIYAQPKVLCPQDTCNCYGDLIQIQTYYFGPSNVKVEAFIKKDLSGLFFTQAGVIDGQLLTINSTSLPDGVFPAYTYLRLTGSDGTSCVTELYSRCPINAWPGATEDLRIVGKTFGNFTIFSHTDMQKHQECSIDNIEQDWHVGGNIVGPSKNTLGTKNKESVQFITDDKIRGILTKDGDFGFGITTPDAKVDVNGNAKIREKLNVLGVATVDNTTASSSANSGALVVKGGLGLAGNLNTGGNVNVDGTMTVEGFTRINDNAQITGNLAVTGTTTIDGATLVNNDTRIARDLRVNGFTTIDGFTKVDDNAQITGELSIGSAGDAVLRKSGTSLIVENNTGNVRFEASNEEMMIISNQQVEVKKKVVVTGADLAERFSVNNLKSSLLPGMVMAIDQNEAGKLVVSDKAYDKTVAGIISGAGGINTAMLLGQAGTAADGDVAVAITGRVYCYVDAAYGAIKPGDILTSSPTYGHAMKVSNYKKAQGAIIGKAMSSLENGKGLVLVLISMQ